MRLRSLSGRLLITSLAWSAFALLSTGVILSSAFRETAEQRFDQTLNVYLSSLIGQLAEARETPGAPVETEVGDPRFRLC